MRAVIHCSTQIAWQGRRSAFFAEGLKARGIPYIITDSRTRLEGIPILLGTTLWRDVERTGDYLLVDRCSFGDTDKFVSLVWNGHGRRGDHRVKNPAPERWEGMGMELAPWKTGHRTVLCGQLETFSPRVRDVSDWYGTVKATHFRPHPSGYSTAPYQIARDFTDCGLAVTLNSSVGVQAVMQGIPTITMDEGAMAWDVTGHSLDDIRTPDRLPWCHWLAWTQWRDEEVKEGAVWDYLW